MIDTSTETYRSVKPFLTEKQIKVLGALRMLNNSATNEQIADYLKWPINTVTPRTGELLAKGLIARGEKVKGKSGRSAYKYDFQSLQLELL